MTERGIILEESLELEKLNLVPSPSEEGELEFLNNYQLIETTLNAYENRYRSCILRLKRFYIFLEEFKELNTWLTRGA